MGYFYLCSEHLYLYLLCLSVGEFLQTEKDDLHWREIELSIKNDIFDVYRRYSAVTDSRVSDLGTEIQKQIDSRSVMEAKLQEASTEPG